MSSKPNIPVELFTCANIFNYVLCLFPDAGFNNEGVFKVYVEDDKVDAVFGSARGDAVVMTEEGYNGEEGTSDVLP